MSFSAGFDPLAVTKIYLNVCYFREDDCDTAEARVADLFPSAKLSWFLVANGVQN